MVSYDTQVRIIFYCDSSTALVHLTPMISRNSDRLLVFSFILFICAITLNFFWTSSAPTNAFVLTQGQSSIQVEFGVSPQASRPGDPLLVEVKLTNLGETTADPALTIAFPDELEVDMKAVQRGTTMDVQTKTMVWRPVIEAGQVRELRMPVTMSLFEVQKPQRELLATINFAGQSNEIRAEYWVGVLPSVSIIGPDTVSVGQSVQLFADVNGPGPLTQGWDLGDGREFDASDPLVQYGSPGTYNVSLTASNPLGRAEATKVITVQALPVSQFQIVDGTPGIDAPTRFINQSGGEPPLEFLWDFGDGTTSTEKDASHLYAQAGTYEVVLTTRNGAGESVARLLVVVGSPPTADILFSTDQSAVGDWFYGSAQGDPSVSQYIWDMGDGRAHVGPEMKHRFGSEGQYAVTLIARNDYGETRVQKFVTVAEGFMEFFLPILNSDRQEGEPPPVVTTEQRTLEVNTDNAEISLNVAPPANSSEAESLFFYINEARVQAGLNPVGYVQTLSDAAQRHTDDMAYQRFRAHQGSDGSWPAQRLLEAGYALPYAGETTAWGFEFASDAVNFWLSSPSHRPIVLNPVATDLGVSFTYDGTAPSIYYWTAEFGSTISSSPKPVLPNPTQAPTAIPPTAVPTAIVPTAVPTIAPTTTLVPLAPTPTQDVQLAFPTLTPSPESTEVIFFPPTATSTPLPTATLSPTDTPPTSIPPTGIPPTDVPPTEAPADEPTVIPTGTDTATPMATETSTPTAVPSPTDEPTATAIPLPTETPSVIGFPTAASEPTSAPLVTTPVPTETPLPTPEE